MLELATLEYPYAECRSIPAIFRKVSQVRLPHSPARSAAGAHASGGGPQVTPRREAAGRPPPQAAAAPRAPLPAPRRAPRDTILPARAQGIPPAGLARVTNGELRGFIQKCIQHDPAARPSALQLLKDPFFDSIRSGARICGGTVRRLIA